MANFFGGIFKRVGSLVSDPIKMTKDTIKNPKKGLKEWSHLYTMNEHKDQDLFKALGIRGWAGKHPQESALAVVGTIFGGWAAWGAYGASAAGGAAGAAGGSGSGIAAGTAIGQTVPATPAMMAAAHGGGAAIGTGANAASATYAATAGTGSSSAILAGSTYGSNYATTLGGNAPIGSASGTNGGANMSWQDWAKQGNRVNNMLNQNQQRQQQQAQAPRAHWQQLQSLNQNTQGAVNVGAQAGNSEIMPATTSDLINNQSTANFNISTEAFN